MSAVVILAMTLPLGTVFAVAPDAAGVGRLVGVFVVLLGLFVSINFWRANVVVDGSAIVSKVFRTRIILLREIDAVSLGGGGFAGWQAPVLTLSNGKRVRLEQVTDWPL